MDSRELINSHELINSFELVNSLELISSLERSSCPLIGEGDNLFNTRQPQLDHQQTVEP